MQLMLKKILLSRPGSDKKNPLKIPRIRNVIRHITKI